MELADNSIQLDNKALNRKYQTTAAQSVPTFATNSTACRHRYTTADREAKTDRETRTNQKPKK
jgi:hypothetical protein